MSGLFLSACAPKPPALPAPGGDPFPEFAAAYQSATAACSGVKTLAASLRMSGKAGRTKLRGRIDAGFAAPGRARLEGVPPIGKPVFVLVANGAAGTLVLTRDDRVLRDAPPADIVEALAGVRLDPDALRTVVSGCALAAGSPAEGRRIGDVASAAVGGAEVYLRRRGDAWYVLGGRRDTLIVTYADYVNGRPSTVRITVGSGKATTADLTLRLSDVSINTPLEPRVFDITPDLPDHPVPLTLEELRRAGPLGGS